MPQSVCNGNSISNEIADAGLESFASLSNGAQAISSKANEYTRRAFKEGSAAVEKILTASSLEDATHLQVQFLHGAYHDFVTGATEFSELYVNMFKGVWRPFEAIVAVTK